MTELFTVLGNIEYPGWHEHMAWGGWWMAIWGTVMMGGLLFLGLYAIRTVGRAPQPDHEHRPPTSRAHAILAERYARGELSREEYHERREDLESSR